MQSQAALEHKPGASRLLLLLLPPPPLPPPAQRTQDFSCTTLPAFSPPCSQKCDRSPKEFPRQVWSAEWGVQRGVRTLAGWVPARPGCSENQLTFPGLFPRHLGASLPTPHHPTPILPAHHQAGAGVGTETGSSKREPSCRCLSASVPRALRALAALKLSVWSFP